MFQRTFYDLLARSVIIRGILTGALILTACYLWATRGSIPSDLLVMVTSITSFYFGALASSQNKNAPPEQQGQPEVTPVAAEAQAKPSLSMPDRG